MHIRSFAPSPLRTKAPAESKQPPATPIPVDAEMPSALVDVSVGAALGGALAVAAASTSGIPAGYGWSVAFPLVTVGLMGGIVSSLIRSELYHHKVNDYQYPNQPTAQLDKLLATPATPEQRKDVQWALSAFGTDNTELLISQGVKIRLQDAGSTYDDRKKELSLQGDRAYPMLQALARALDDAAVPDTQSPLATRSGVDPEMTIRFRERQKLDKEQNRWIHRMATPQDYLAEATADYLANGVTRQNLERDDPNMAAYVARWLNNPQQG